MKKVYLGLLSLTLVGSTFAQVPAFQKSSAARTMTRMESVKNNGKVQNNVAKSSVYTETFDTWPLTGWTIQNGPTSTVTAATQTWHQFATGNPGTSAGVVYVNSVDIHDQELITPAIDIPAGAHYFAFDFNTSVYWHAQTLGGSYNNADIYVVASTDDGATWSNKLWQEDSLALLDATYSNNWETYEWKRAFINATQFAGNTVKFKFVYKGQDAAQFSVDNVEVLAIPDYDVAVSQFILASNSPEGGDYYLIPQSQGSFPGFVFHAITQNVGGLPVDAILTATADGYNGVSAPLNLAVGVSDTLSVETVFAVPTANGLYAVDLVTGLGANTDANPANNQANFTITRNNYDYARDNGILTGSIGQVGGQDEGLSLFIGNVMEVFDEMTVTGIKLAIPNQAAAVGQPIDARIEILNQDGSDFTFFAESDMLEIEESQLGTWVTLKMLEEVVIPANSTILVLAHHYGGTEEVTFGMAQNTTTGSVLGRTANGNLFNLSSPGAIMIRLTEDPTLSAKAGAKLAGVDVYPNPSTGVINVSNDKNVESTVVVTDLTGKVVTSKVSSAATSFDLSNKGAGVYFVTVSNATGSMVQKVVIK